MNDVRALPMRDRLICALDMPDATEARRVIDELDGVVSFFKVGLTLNLASGLEVVDGLIAAGKRVFLDLKFFDVPETVRQAVAVAARRRVTFLTVHGEREIVQAAVAGRGDSDLKLLAVTVLTSLDADGLASLTGNRRPVEEIVLERARFALANGCDGVVSSALEVERIKRETEDRLLVITPGIREEDAPADDQKRKATPAEAVARGADYLVVGRPIIGSPDRVAAATRIIERMEAGRGARP